MANSDVRHVRCPRCHGLLQEPAGAPVYQCGGCGATLRAKNRSAGVPTSAYSPSSTSGLPPPASTSRCTTPRTPDAGDVASTSGSGSTPEDAVTTSRRRSQETSSMANPRHTTPEDNVTSSGGRRHATGTTSRRHHRSAAHLVQPAAATSQKGGARESCVETKAATATLESQVDDSEKRRRKTQAPPLPDAARNKELAPRSSAQAAATSPPHRHQAQQDLAPLRHKILKAVDDLRGDLSELFSRSPDLNPTMTTRATRRPPRLLPKQGDDAAAEASALPAATPRRASVPVHGNANAARPAAKPGRVAAPPRRGLPSRRYRRCRAHPCCCEHAQPRRPTCQCHHHQGNNNKPECSSCRGHCRKAQQEWTAAPPQRRRPPPRHHCRPVLKGAPFIVCSSCFQLVQVPADFAVSTGRLRKLRCGACSAVLSYSYRDPGRKKQEDLSDDSVDQRTDPFAPFLDGCGLSSYSTTEDEQPPLHVSRNTSFDSVVKEGVADRLHRLMGYGSASELLRRHSPDLYESGFHDYRTTPEYDRKGKAVCIDAEDDKDDSDDDEDNRGAGMRSAARGAVWPMPGAIRIKS